MTREDWLRAWNALDEVERALKTGPPGAEAGVAEAMDLLLRLRHVMTAQVLPAVQRETHSWKRGEAS